MNKSGPIVVIDDDADDCGFMIEAIRARGWQNEIKVFENGESALLFLHEPHVQPFLIISDINMPTMSGFELRQTIYDDQELREKCVPYIFFTTGATIFNVQKAYKLSIQGFFIKPHSMGDYETLLDKIIDYWSEASSPARLTLMPQS